MPVSDDRSDWTLILILFATGILAAWQFAKVALILPQLADGYASSPVELAWLVSVVGVVGILVGAIAGNLVAAMGARRVLLWALWIGGSLSVIQAAWLPVPVLGVTRMAEGISHTLIVVAAPTLIAGAASDGGRPIAMGLWAMFFGVAFAIGAVLFPPIVAQLGAGGLFILHGTALLIMALMLAPRLAPQPRRPLRLVLWDVHRRIYAEPLHAMPGLCFVFYTVLFVALLTLLPVALGRPDLALILPLVSLSGTFAAGWLSKRFAPQAVAASGFTFTGLFALAAWSGLDWAAVPLFATMGLVPGACFALIPHLNAAVPDRALATGGIAQMGNVGTTLGTPIFAAILAMGGVGAMWWGTVLIATAGLATTLLLTRIVRQRGTTAVISH